MAASALRSALASRSRRSSASVGDGMDGASAGASTVESSSEATLGASAAEGFIITPLLCTEIIEDSLPRVADSERTVLRAAMGAGLARPQVADMRARLEATRGSHAASRAAIAGQLLVAALVAAGKVTGPTQATGDSPPANEGLLDDQARRVVVVSAAAAAVGRADSLLMEAPVPTVADILAAGVPAVATAVAEDTAEADTVAGAEFSI